ncbi:MAG: UbiH/UbiF/VisC/COQ6 family ubiquinone biosynthesis hydroxylase [Gammaproteobacteria bacterium]
MKQHDIVIVGDGVIGLTLAHALAQREINVALISQQAFQVSDNPQKYDTRVSAITLSSERIFKSIGVWDKIVARRVSPFRDLRVWDATGPGQIHFDSAWAGQSHFGHIIENSVMLAALQENITTYPTLTCYNDTELTELLKTAEGIIVKTAEQTLMAKLLIGADGANSWVRQAAGFTLEQESYKQVAIVATVQMELAHHETALQRFMPTGPLAFLPLNHSHDCSIVWSCAPEMANQILAYDDEQFCQQLAEAIEFRLGKVLESSPRLSFPLIMRHAERYVMPHIALVGDAAHTIHPLAGQGMNMGLLDVAVLVDTINKMYELKRPLGYLPLLRQYERERRSANLLMIKMMDGFKRLFSNTNPLLITARNYGLNATDSLPWLKTMLMQHAMGNQIETPVLARES